MMGNNNKKSFSFLFSHCIQYKISTICFNSTSGTALQYLSDILQPYTPAKQLQSASDTQTFVNTKTCLILPPLLKPPSRRTCLIITVFHSCAYPLIRCMSVCVCMRVCVHARVRVCVCVSVVSVLVKPLCSHLMR